MTRSPSEIVSDIKSARARLVALRAELAATYASRREAVIDDLNAGKTYHEIVVAHGIPEGSVASIGSAARVGRRLTKGRLIKTLSPQARTEYNRLRRAMGRHAALAIVAEKFPSGAPPFSPGTGAVVSSPQGGTRVGGPTTVGPQIQERP